MNATEPLPRGDAKARAVRAMFDAIAPRYQLVNSVMTLGADTRWRRVSLQRLQLDPSSTVLDLACGTGDFCRLIEHEGHLAIGVDLSLGMLENAQTTAPLIQADVLCLPFADQSVDGVTCGFALRNFVELPSFFDEVARVTRVGGRVAFVDAYQPRSRLLRYGHKLYFGKLVPVIGGLLSGNREAYAYLPRSVSYMPSPVEVAAQMEAAGLRNVDRVTFFGGAAHLFTATR